MRGLEGSGGQRGAVLAQAPPSRAAPPPSHHRRQRPSYSALSVRAGGLRVRRTENGSRKSAAHTV